MDIPSKCGECRHLGVYKDGPWARNPHCCCELWWDLFEEDYKVDENTLDEKCPIKNDKFREAIEEMEKDEYL